MKYITKKDTMSIIYRSICLPIYLFYVYVYLLPRCRPLSACYSSAAGVALRQVGGWRVDSTGRSARTREHERPAGVLHAAC